MLFELFWGQHGDCADSFEATERGTQRGAWPCQRQIEMAHPVPLASTGQGNEDGPNRGKCTQTGVKQRCSVINASRPSERRMEAVVRLPKAYVARTRLRRIFKTF